MLQNYFKNLDREKLVLVLFTFLICIGMFLRLYKFEGFSTFLGDQGRDAVIIKNIALGKEFVQEGAPSSLGGVRLGPAYYYLMAPFLLLFAFDPIGIAYGVLFLTLLGMIVSFWLIMKEYNADTALFFTFLCVIAYPLVEISRFAWNPNLAPICSFLTLYFTYRFVTSEKVTDAVAFGAFFSLATQMHHLAFLLGIPIVLVSIHRLFTKDKELTFVRNTVISIVSFCIFYIPFIMHELETDFENIDALTSLFTNKTIVTENHPVFTRFLETTRYFLQNIFHVPELPEYSGLLFFIGFFALSIYAIRRSHGNMFITLHALYGLLFLIFFSLLNSARHPHYYNSVYLSIFFIVAYGITLIPQKNIRFSVISIVAVSFLWITVPKYYYFTESPHNQLEKAKVMAEAFEGKIFNEPIRIAVLPGNETHDQYRYFLDLKGVYILPYDSRAGDPQELYVICLEATCDPVNDPGWPIESFYDKKMMDHWNTLISDKEITIHRIIHDPEKQRD